MKDPIIPTVEAIEDLQRCIDYWGRRTEKAEAENVRLRAALRELNTVMDFSVPAETCACYPRGAESLNAAMEQAREALNHEQKVDK